MASVTDVPAAGASEAPSRAHELARRLTGARRVVVKLGSSLIADGGSVRREWLAGLSADLARLHAGADVVVVSSGAIALGRVPIGYGRGRLKLEESQAAAAVGQIALAAAWTEALAAERYPRRARCSSPCATPRSGAPTSNARTTIDELLKARRSSRSMQREATPSPPPRSATATNDRLAARVATMISADCLVLLSDVDGLYTAPPAQDPSARLIP